MEKYAIIFKTYRTSPTVSDAVDRDAVMTVGNLISYLDTLEEDDLVLLDFGDGFTHRFGTLDYKDEGSISEFE